MFDFFNTFIKNPIVNAVFKPVVNIVQNIARFAQRVSQVVSGYAGDQQGSKDASAFQSNPVKTLTPKELEKLRAQREKALQQRKLAEKAAKFDRDVARKEADGDDQPLKYPTGYLSKPADAGIRWLGDKEAQKVIQMMQDTPALVDAMLSIASSPKAAFDLLLAQGINLSSEVLLQIIASGKDSIGDQHVGLTSDSPVYQGNDDIQPWWEQGLGTVVVSYQLSPGESLRDIGIRMNIPEDVLLEMNMMYPKNWTVK